MTTETITDTTDKTERVARDDICPKCGNDELDGDFVSSGGDSAIQEMFCPNCSETWENHYSFDRMDFPGTGEVVHVETEIAKQFKDEIENLKAELAAAKGQVHEGSEGREPAKIKVENGSEDDPSGIDAYDIDKCPHCGGPDIDEDQRGKIFEDSGYFDYKCYGCKGTWTIAGTIDRVILN